MVFSSEELQISNKSYINKDFPTIYNELLDVAQKISYKYDPTTSNESDPMIVLIKLLALVGDKLNYNVDKNILERFLPSITQWNSMQERTSSLGYNMHYYNSAIGYITMKFDKRVDDNDIANIKKVEFPAFETKFSNSQNNINYILTEPIIFEVEDIQKGLYIEKPIIQGEIKHYTTLNGDESLVTLDDLDSNNRLYFPEAMVAQNGIFIKQDNILDKWELVDNLNVQVPKKRCYIFRYDSAKKLPYIQFPEDVASLIDGGLSIKYIITNGENGNISANSIDTLLTNGIVSTISGDDSTDTTLFSSLENYIVTNNSALTNGTDIENIDEAYASFQKTVGTLDTLVTCRDYANYIYNLSDENFNSLVSNIQVCDRRDDYNYSYKVVTYNEFGQATLTKVNQIDSTDSITAFDLMLYSLRPMIGTGKDAYKNSFKALTDDSIIKNSIENLKCLSHNYKQLANTDIYAIKNYYKIKAKITTTYNVDTQEQISIRNNIISALENNFNARKVNYGEEIPLDTISQVILKSDSRIKSISSIDYVLNPVLLTQNGETDLFDYTTSNPIKYIANNVLAGRISLYDYDTQFDYNYNQEDNDIYNNVFKLSTCANITLPINNYYTLQNNEVVQIFTPSFVNSREWSYGWFYKTVGNISSSTDEQIVELDENKYIEIYDSNSANIPTIVLNDGYVKIKGIINKTSIAQINSGASITEQILNEVKLTTTNYLYWITNNIVEEDNVEKSFIAWDNNTYTLLDGEYLYVTDSRYSYLYAYGPGTKLIRPNDSDMMNDLLELLNVNDINTQGISYLQDKFIRKDFSSDFYLTLEEQQILTLSSGDKIKTYNSTQSLYETSSDKYINKLIELNNKIDYMLSDGSEGSILNTIANKDVYIRARLDVNCSNVEIQKLLSNQYIYIYYYDGDTEIEETLVNASDTYKNILSKYSIKVVGGQDRLVKTYSFSKQNYINNILYVYTTSATSSGNVDDNILSIGDAFDNYYKLSVIDGNCKSATQVTIKNPIFDGKDNLVMVYVNPLTVDQIDANGIVTTLSLQNPGYGMTYPEYDTSDPDNPVEIPVTILHKGMNVLRFNSDTSTASNPFIIKFNDGNQLSTPTKFSGTIVVSKPRILNGVYTTAINPNLGIPDDYIDDLLNQINEQKEEFYYSLYVDNASFIDDNLSDQQSLFNVNNIVNKIVIPEIDIDYAISNISITTKKS